MVGTLVLDPGMAIVPLVLEYHGTMVRTMVLEYVRVHHYGNTKMVGMVL